VEALFVHRTMMPATERGEIGKSRRSALRPVMDVVALDESDSAARESTTLIAMEERASQRGRNGSCSCADLYDVTVRVVAHHHASRIAGETLRRFRGNARSVVEHGLTCLIRIREYRRIDVHHDLIPVARGARFDPLVERRFREERKGISLLLRHRRCLTRRVCERRRVFGASLLIQRLARRRQGLYQPGAGFRPQPSAHDDHAVIVLIHMQRSAFVPLRRLTRLGLPVDGSPAAHDALDMRGRASLRLPGVPLGSPESRRA